MRKKLVVFVCVGNACRSPMAEGFARTLGADVMEAVSAGVSPAGFVSDEAKQVMQEKGIDITTYFSKGLNCVNLFNANLVVSVGGPTAQDIMDKVGQCRLPYHQEEKAARQVPEIREWGLADPIGLPVGFYRLVRDQIEEKISALVTELEQDAKKTR